MDFLWTILFYFFIFCVLYYSSAKYCKKPSKSCVLSANIGFPANICRIFAKRYIFRKIKIKKEILRAISIHITSIHKKKIYIPKLQRVQNFWTLKIIRVEKYCMICKARKFWTLYDLQGAEILNPLWFAGRRNFEPCMICRVQKFWTLYDLQGAEILNPVWFTGRRNSEPSMICRAQNFWTLYDLQGAEFLNPVWFAGRRNFEPCMICRAQNFWTLYDLQGAEILNPLWFAGRRNSEPSMICRAQKFWTLYDCRAQKF